MPNNAYRNTTFASRLGVMLGTTTSISGTVRHIDTSAGTPNAFNYFGIADDSSQKRNDDVRVGRGAVADLTAV